MRALLPTGPASHLPEYRVWNHIKTRCLNPRSDRFPYYGGRGIKICQRWRSSFVTFYADMGPRPSPLHSVERKNNNGDYEPDNCRWATRVEQVRNRRSNVMVTYGGRTQCATDWAAERGIQVTLILDRLERGWTPERTFTRPPNPQVYTFEGETLTVVEWGKRTGLQPRCIRKRLRKGWPIAEALSPERHAGRSRQARLKQ